MVKNKTDQPRERKRERIAERKRKRALTRRERGVCVKGNAVMIIYSGGSMVGHEWSKDA